MNKKLLPLLFVANLFPLIGAIQHSWTFFSVVYLFWIELLIMSFFQAIKIVLAQKDTQITTLAKIIISIRFLFGRLGLLLFYFIFIVVFCGIMSSNQEGILYNMRLLSFSDNWFNLSILNFIFYNAIQLGVYYINKTHLSDHPYDLNNFFDFKIIVIHVVVILGTFLYKFVIENLLGSSQIANLSCIILFIAVKIVVDTVSQRSSKLKINKDN